MDLEVRTAISNADAEFPMCSRARTVHANAATVRLPTCEGEPTREDPITGERIEPGEASSVKAIKIDDKQIEEAAA